MFAEKEQKPQVQISASQHPVQTKLEIGSKDNPQEKEADEVARKVMGKAEPGAAAGSGTGMIHRMHDETETVHRMNDEEEQKVHKMHDEEEGKVMTMKDEIVQPRTDKPLMMQADPGGGGGMATPAFQQQLNSTKGSGDPLPGNIQRDFAASTGNDLSGVKVHTDSNAHEMSAGINAKAFTHGQDIYFKQGQYNPTSDSGKELIYHEAQHTVQQGGVQRKVQRFGAASHERVESYSLTQGKTAFSSAEAKSTYFGNWSRDFNQMLAPGFVTDYLGLDGAYALVSFMAAFKFGIQPSFAELGIYNPKEHIDNPGAIYPGEDMYTSVPSLKNPILDNKGRPGPSILTPLTKIDTNFNNKISGETEHKTDLFAVDQTGLMAYIRDSNTHVENRLRMAVNSGRTESGLFHLGVALHAIEDLFAHSNFTEIALGKILKDEPGLLSKKLKKEDREVFSFMPSVNVNVADKGGNRPVLTTGTFSPDDAKISIAGEIVDFLNAFNPYDLNKDVSFSIGDKVEMAFDKLLLAISGRDEIKNLLSGQVSELIKGYATDSMVNIIVNQYIAKSLNVYKLYSSVKSILLKFPLQSASKAIFRIIIKKTIQVLYDRLKGMVAGAGIQNQVAKTPLFAQQKLQAAERAKLKAPAQDIVSRFKLAKDTFEKNPKDTKAKADYIDASKELLGDVPKDFLYAAHHDSLYKDRRKSELYGPSHSQIAKDHPNSIFFSLAFALASHADQLIKDKLLAAWKGRPQNQPGPAANIIAQSDIKEKQKEGKEIIEKGSLDNQLFDPEKVRQEKLLVMKSAIHVFKIIVPNKKENAHYNSVVYILDAIARGIESMNVYDYKRRSDLHRLLLQTMESFKYFLDSPGTTGLSAVKSKMVLALFAEVAGYLAPNHYPEQHEFGQGKMDLDKGNQLKLTTIKLAPIVENAATTDLLQTSRNIIGHPYDNDWWKKTIRDFINNHPDQIANEIKMRNAGYTIGEGPEH